MSHHAPDRLPDNQRIVITGVGLTAPNGNDLAEFRKALLAGQSGVTESATAAFEHALRIALQVAAFSSSLGGIGLWLWIRPIGSQAAR